MTTSPPSTLVDRARHVAALAAEHAARAEAARAPHPEVLAAVTAAGFASHGVPAPFGRPGRTLAELKRAVALVAAECPATAWCAVLAALMSRTAGYLPPRGREALWADGPEALVAGAVTPRGSAAPVAGGWSLSGTWPSVTTAEDADWLLLAAVVREDGKEGARVFAVERAAVRVERTWDDVGMRATGSHTVVADEVFVAAPMTFPFACLTAVDDPPPGPDGRPVPLLAVNAFAFCLPMLGAAQGALRRWRELTDAKLRAHPAAYDPVVAHYADVFARSASEIDAADLVLDRVARVVDSGAPVGRAEVARNQRDCAFAAGLLVGAVDQLMRASGTSGHSTSLGLQRLWRDVHTAGAHRALQFGTAAAGYAREFLRPAAPAEAPAGAAR
ncbi:hydrolase [Streptomyces longispororuber]|uniref:Hydrolase n=1 Tax=Streptomyces longispororuber TaxID=68230 RepID=A0A918Z5T8_9ACTN|nr:acyl-CoA dehydrogenase family protein [Streptomyces longispororuber]GHE38016.1 hydrolase [Streptomyces longispororuber]